MDQEQKSTSFFTTKNVVVILAVIFTFLIFINHILPKDNSELKELEKTIPELVNPPESVQFRSKVQTGGLSFAGGSPTVVHQYSFDSLEATSYYLDVFKRHGWHLSKEDPRVYKDPNISRLEKNVDTSCSVVEIIKIVDKNLTSVSLMMYKNGSCSDDN